MKKYETRRQAILQCLQRQKSPITGSALADRFHVTRQIIVGDIADLRASGYPITSTPKGYILIPYESPGIRKSVVCKHSVGELRTELEIIVGHGGILHNVVVDHDVYGTLEAQLYITSQDDIETYLATMKKGESSLLCSLCGGIHTHVIETKTRKDMEKIINALSEASLLKGE